MAFKFSKYRELIFLIGFVLLFGIVLIFILLSQNFGTQYSQEVDIQTTPRELKTGTQTFSIKKLTIKDNQACETLQLEKNGYASKIGCDNSLDARQILATERLAQVFNNLTREEFEQLETNYYDEDLDLVITIETNYGTKTIVINSTNPNNSEPLPESIQDIIEESEEIEEEIEQPPVSPPPTINPTATPTPNPQATPSPTPLGGGPTPTPLPPGVTPQPFSCDMLQNLGVTVSNIRCTDQGQPPQP